MYNRSCSQQKPFRKPSAINYIMVNSSWWFQPPLKNISQNENLPQVGVKKKYLKPPSSNGKLVVWIGALGFQHNPLRIPIPFNKGIQSESKPPTKNISWNKAKQKKHLQPKISQKLSHVYIVYLKFGLDMKPETAYLSSVYSLNLTGVLILPTQTQCTKITIHLHQLWSPKKLVI